MSGLLVVSPGFLTTVQDLGRPGHAASGISASGAADPIALTIGNRLVGNLGEAAALEMTIVGGVFRFERDGIAALTGADASSRLNGTDIAPWRAFAVNAGDTLACTAFRGGARAYLCLRGGLVEPIFMASASTHLLTGLGGHEGRALIAGDRLTIGDDAPGAPLPFAIDAATIPGYRPGEPFRVTDGPQADWFSPDRRERFFATAWRVTESCDRMGIRLAGDPLNLAAPRELVTEGVCLGAVQVPAGGEPIVLFVEHQTTGGYPKIANVIAADLARLGTLKPRDVVRFERVTIAEARRLLRQQAEALDALFA